MKLTNIFQYCNRFLLESPISDLKARYKKNGVEFTPELLAAFEQYKSLKDKEKVKPHTYMDDPQGFILAVNAASGTQTKSLMVKEAVKSISKGYV